MGLSGLACDQLEISGWQVPGDKKTRRVGTGDVSCSPRDTAACAAICDSMRPTPNSTATASFPEGAPVIRLTAGSGWGGQQTTKIWRDGTVVFSDGKCRKLRGARTKISSQQVTQLIAR